MTNIEKCKAALAQGLRVQHGGSGIGWLTMSVLDFDGPENCYRIHPEDERKFVDPGATPAKHQNLSTRTVNGRTYTHRTSVGGICRIICRDLISTHPVVVAVLREEGSEITALYKSEDGLTPGVDPAFVVDWSKVAIDTPIWVRDEEGKPWIRAHFAGVDSCRILTFYGGRTSHSSNNAPMGWGRARLTQPE
jgi:hypothetical protein